MNDTMDKKPDDSCSTAQQPLEANSSQSGETVSEENFREKWLRALAENENVRRRCEKEKEDQVRYANFAFAKEVISIADNLERALMNIPEEKKGDMAQLYHGIDLTYKEVLRIFKKFNIHKVQALGEGFDPHYHQVMFEKEDMSCEPRTVIEVLQDGYTLHERLLRPALVSISKTESPQAPVV